MVGMDAWERVRENEVPPRLVSAVIASLALMLSYRDLTVTVVSRAHSTQGKAVCAPTRFLPCF